MIAGYLTGTPHPTGAESVNCNLTAAGETDIHLSLAPSPRATEYEGIVVELIHQHRPAGWTTAKLLAITTRHIPVLVTGQLFYDSKHFINACPGVPQRAEQPKRFSLWEVHPMHRFLVCSTKDCDMEDLDTEGWIELRAWAP